MPSTIRVLIPIMIGALLLLQGCDDNPVSENDGEPDFITSLSITPNVSGFSPLTAVAELNTSRPVQVEVVIEGREGGAGDIEHRFDGVGEQHSISLLGLYPVQTDITFRFFDENGVSLGQTSRMVTTPPLPSAYPEITIDAANRSEMKPGVNIVSYFGHDGRERPQLPFIFDAAGDVRWYLDLTQHPTLSELFYDDGIEMLTNGNLYFGDGNSGQIVEMNFLGEVVNTWPMPGYEFHHNVIEKPNGNFVATVTKLAANTIEDYLIEIDRQTGDIIREWDLNQSMEYGRRVWVSRFADPNVDWFHGNGLIHDPTDDTIIVSGRTQGTVKLTNDNEVVWIVSPHRDWGDAGNGTDLTTKLLQPLDASGQAITDSDVLNGVTNHPDFEWAWYQHAPELMPDGTLLLFDNGDDRNYSDVDLYSRAVAYRIDPDAMTIQQVWQYGKERGNETFSRIVSDVDYHVDENNVVFMPGAAGRDAVPYGKVIEVDYTSRNVIFEATITAPTAQFGITFHRVERVPFYSVD